MITELLIALAMLIFLVFIRYEIAFAIGFAALLLIFVTDSPFMTGISRMFGGLNSFTLLAVPFFLLAAELMNHADITRRLVRIANLTIGRVRGGLAQANILTSLLFAGISGAAIADVAALGKIFVPEMADSGYDRDFSAAVTAASSLVGPIIPPSLIIVLYGAITSTSIAGLFAAAIIPGILLTILLMAIVFVQARIHDFPTSNIDIQRNEYPAIFGDSLLVMTMPGIILFGIIGGVFTATEAAAVACAYAILLGVFIYSSLSISDIYSSLLMTAERTTQLFAILAFSTVLSWILAAEGIPILIASTIDGMNLGMISFLLLIALILIALGTWLDIAAALLILAPVLTESAEFVGVHPFQFGILMSVALLFGLITPPLGVCLFVASSVSNIPVWPIVKQILPFYIADLAVLLLIIVFPEVTLFLPGELGLL